MKFFCRHSYKAIENNYIKLGYYKCGKCGKEKYIGENISSSEFEFGEFEIKKE